MERRKGDSWEWGEGGEVAGNEEKEGRQLRRERRKGGSWEWREGKEVVGNGEKEGR